MQGALHSLSWKRLADGRVHAIAGAATAPGSAAAPDWGDAACVDAALAAVADACAAEAAARGVRVTLASGALYAVLDEALSSDGVCCIRRVASEGACAPPELPAPAAPSPGRLHRRAAAAGRAAADARLRRCARGRRAGGCGRRRRQFVP
jgi:hypothetical protein